MGELEVLLNKLMGWGWEPRGRKKTLHITIYDCDLNVYLDGGFLNEDKKSFRELVSKESGLWQFCIEKGMVNGYGYKSSLHEGTDSKWCKYYDRDYRYWLCESALKDEDELEKLILDNIKV